MILNREAFAVARLTVDENIIAAALLPAAVCAGLPKSEAVRTIRDAVQSRRGEK